MVVVSVTKLLVVKHADTKTGIAENRQNKFYICVFYHQHAGKERALDMKGKIVRVARIRSDPLVEESSQDLTRRPQSV